MAVQFDEDQSGQIAPHGDASYGGGNFQGDQPQSKMASWLIRHKIVKSEKAANVFLIVLSLCFLLLSVFIIFKFVL